MQWGRGGATLWGHSGVMAVAAVIHCNHAMVQGIETWGT